MKRTRRKFFSSLTTFAIHNISQIALNIFSTEYISLKEPLYHSKAKMKKNIILSILPVEYI